MTKKPIINNITERVMATQDKGKSAEMNTMMKAGLLRKIAPKVYATNMEDTSEKIKRRNYIKGTELEIGDALQIVETGQPMPPVTPTPMMCWAPFRLLRAAGRCAVRPHRSTI